MKRSSIRPSTKPMKRTPMRRGTTRMKSRGPKMTPIRKSAMGQDCTLGIAGVCNGNPETTVWAHSNQLKDGKGIGIKARDEEGCYACSSCHAWLDGGWAQFRIKREMVDQIFDVARKLSQAILRRKGLMA
jgi:hypothetical protein